jgi:APA family basic amino acid/polyamine antiporter
VVNLVAAAASLGSMLALLAGVSRTAATMAEDRELPTWFSARNRHGAPWLAEVLVAIGAVILAQFGRLDWVIGFSSLSVLAYYLIGHIAALRQPAEQRVMGRWVAFAGSFFCVLIASAVPGPAIWLSALVLLAALFVRRVARRP